MIVPEELQVRIQHRISECIDIIERKYHRRIPSPKVAFDVTGTESAKANMKKWLLRINPVLLVQNSDKFIAETVPHEIAHFATDMFYPHVHRPALGEKRNAHGRQWTEIMNALGVTPNAHHNYDTTDVHTRPRFKYQCNTCGKLIPLGPKRHKALQETPGAYHCKCSDKSLLTFVETIEPRKADDQPAGSRFKRCKEIFIKAQGSNVSRKAMIDRFIFEAGCSPATASTYYAGFKKNIL